MDFFPLKMTDNYYGILPLTLPFFSRNHSPKYKYFYINISVDINYGRLDMDWFYKSYLSMIII